MSEVILTVEDVFQVDNRGSVVTGVIGNAWKNAKVGDAIVLCIPTGTRLATAIKKIELFRPPIWKETSDNGALLLTDLIDSDQAPRGTRILPYENVA